MRVVINGLPYARTIALGHFGAEAGLCAGARNERTHEEVTSLSLSLSLWHRTGWDLSRAHLNLVHGAKLTGTKFCKS